MNVESPRFEIVRRDHLERAVLACVYRLACGGSPWRELAPGLVSKHFHHPAARVIFNALTERAEAGKAIDDVLLENEIGSLEEAPLVHDFLIDVMSHPGAAELLPAYVNELLELCATEEARGQWDDLGRLAAKGLHPAELRTRARALYEAQEAGDAQGQLATPEDSIRALWARPLPPPLETGMNKLDALLGGGIRAENLVILNGPTGSGKTALAVQWALGWAFGRQVVYLSTELSARQVWARFIGRKLDRPWSGFFEAAPSEAQHLCTVLKGMNLNVIELDGGRRIDEVLARVGDGAVVVLDYIQHAASHGADDMRLATTAWVNELAAWARRKRGFAIAISAVSRANYDAQDREGAALVGAGKESGEAEYRAGHVLYLERAKEGRTRLHLSKSRFSEGDKVLGLRFDGALGLFTLDKEASLSPDQREAYHLIQKQGIDSANGLMKAMGIKRDKALRLFGKLRERGFVNGANPRHWSEA